MRKDIVIGDDEVVLCYDGRKVSMMVIKVKG